MNLSNDSCRFCKDNDDIINCREPFKPEINVFIVNESLVIIEHDPFGNPIEVRCDINYCPMCGDKLNG